MGYLQASLSMQLLYWWFFLFFQGSISAHGGLVYPYTWYDPTGAQTDKVLDPDTDVGPAPVIGCWSNSWVKVEGIGDWSKDELCHIKWFSNNTRPSGPRTLPKHMFERGPWKWNSRNPWAAPGTTPVFGPCGTAGGNPNGCSGGSKGTCCGGDCKAYAYGRNALEYTFDQASQLSGREAAVRRLFGGFDSLTMEVILIGYANFLQMASEVSRKSAFKRLL